MSMIDKMSILGIRAFGVRDEEKQVIEFQHPLTLIVGENGAGKTTIIECLKYITTGDQPGNTKGGAFIHDPKLVGETEVRAQVGLRFFDIQGRSCTVKRSMQLNQKADKSTVKTLDGVITKDKGGERVAVTSKCADINSEMVSMLGVSKAVLENVIFCHQEDSNWPLAEGKTVKQKFDDIFAATRYIKALDLIKLARKEKDKDNKTENTKLTFLKGHRETADEKKQNLQENERKLNAARDSASQVEKELRPLEKKLQEIDKGREEIMAMDRQLGETKSRHTQMKEDRKRLVERIQNIFHGTDEQLHQLVDGQEKIQEAKRIKLEKYEDQVGPIEQECSVLTKKKNDLLLKQGKLQQEFESFQAKIEERNCFVRESSEELDVCSGRFSSRLEISEDDAAEFEGEIRKKIRKEIEVMSAKQKRLENNINDCNREIQNVWQAKTELEEGTKHRQQAVRDKQRKIEEMSREIMNLQSASDVNRLNDLQKQLQQAEKDLQLAETSYNVEEIGVEVKKLNQNKSQLEGKLRQIEQEIVSMQRHAQARTTIDLLKKDQSSKEDLVQRIKRRNVDALTGIDLLESGKSIDEQTFPTRQSLSRWISRKEDEGRLMQRDLDKKRQEQTKLTTKHDILMKELGQKNQRYKDIDEEMFELCGSEDFEDDLKTVEAEIKDLQGSKGLTDGIQFMYKEFLKKLKSSADHQNTPCPLCHRLFDQGQEVEELAQELERKLEVAPRKMLTQQQDLEKKQKRYELLLQQRPAKEEMDKLKSEIIPNLKKEISELKSRITRVKQEITEKEELFRKVQDDETAAKSCSNDVSQIDTTMVDIKDLTRKVKSQEAQIPNSSGTERSFESLNSEKQNLAKTIEKHNKVIEEKRENMDMQKNKLLKLRENVNSVQSEKLKLASDVQKCEQMKENRKSVAEEIKQLKTQIKTSVAEIAPLERQYSELENKKKTLTQNRDEEMKICSDALQLIKNRLQEIIFSNNEIKKYLKSGNEQLLEKTVNTIQKHKLELSSLGEKRQNLREQIATLQKDQATCKDRKRDLDDNVALRKQDAAIEDVGMKIKNMQEKLGGMDSMKLEKESSSLTKQWHTLSKEKERCKTRQESFKEIVHGIKRELEKEDLKYADERYRDCLIKVTTTKLAIDDLEKYHNALDRAIMRYHHLKMLEINKIIKDIWQETYRGQDIDYIEICSDEDTSTSSSTRRVYHYRLVKCMGGEKIDMRGRCSAGQKVLSSLVIRLALAETFCINCGILALDEPTTNLDRHHIESLANALIGITESREAQRNFQLIIITHDEDFVELLGRSRYADHFFRVSKERGKSQIVRCPIHTING